MGNFIIVVNSDFGPLHKTTCVVPYLQPAGAESRNLLYCRKEYNITKWPLLCTEKKYFNAAHLGPLCVRPPALQEQ